MSERAERWGIVPSYYGWQGDLVQTTPETEQAILAAMGATKDDPTPPHSWGGGAASAGGADTGTKCADPPERVWGWAAQLYALRSRDSWGIGDLADLRHFARWSKEAGASLILLNPLGAQTPTFPYEPSPYYASTRRFRNVVYLNVDEVEGAQQIDSELAPIRDAARDLNRKRIIDYDQVFRLKSDALERIFRTAPKPKGFESWVRRQGKTLRDFATFNALCETHGRAWRKWPENVHRPDGAGTKTARRELAERVAYHQWLQFHLDRQLARASREIGLIADVPVGFASDGFDAWRWQDYLAPGMRVGAPPDEFFRDGQDWGLPPFNPWKLSDAGWAPFVDAIRSAGRHSAGIRLDHVMGLFRLFWIPQGMTPAQGAYVRYPAPTLLRLLALESGRAKAFVIGEDLGLVEPAVRKSLDEIGSLSYRLLWFEGSEPAQWPHDAVAAVGTHDLPTVAGIWTHSEPEHRLHHLREKLVNMTHLPDDTPPLDVSIAAYGALAQGRPRIVLVSMEDALAVHERPNVPGTTTEFPNWRLALPSPIEDIQSAAGVRRIVEEMTRAGRSRTHLEPR
jgi:4-alpha-glucanotransferase